MTKIVRYYQAEGNHMKKKPTPVRIRASSLASTSTRVTRRLARAEVSGVKKKAPLTPRQARTQAQLCALPRDNVTCATWWALLDGDMILCKQRSGEPATGLITIPRAEWNALVDWYETGRWKERARRKLVAKRRKRR